jgi:hypothetical protein
MHKKSRDRSHSTGERQASIPPAWLSTNALEDEIMAGIEASGAEQSSALAIIDEYLSGDDEFEPEAEHRRVLLWLLSLLRPRLADLLGGPSAG